MAGYPRWKVLVMVVVQHSCQELVMVAEVCNCGRPAEMAGTGNGNTSW